MRNLSIFVPCEIYLKFVSCIWVTEEEGDKEEENKQKGKNWDKETGGGRDFGGSLVYTDFKAWEENLGWPTSIVYVSTGILAKQRWTP